MSFDYFYLFLCIDGGHKSSGPRAEKELSGIPPHKVNSEIMINIEFLGIFVLLLISTALSTIISSASYLLGEKKPDNEKVSAYECGFDPFESSRIPFSVRFFLVGILFLIFDLEISYLFP